MLSAFGKKKVKKKNKKLDTLSQLDVDWLTPMQTCTQVDCALSCLNSLIFKGSLAV